MNSTYLSGSGKWKRFGKVVYVYFDLLTLKSNISDSGNGYTLFSNLPSPIDAKIRFANGRLVANDNGFRTWWDEFTAGNYDGFSFTYIAG